MLTSDGRWRGGKGMGRCEIPTAQTAPFVSCASADYDGMMTSSIAVNSVSFAFHQRGAAYDGHER
jgi:hypothetical protein